MSTNVIQLVDDLAHRVFDSGYREHLDWFRDLILPRFSKIRESPRDSGNAVQSQHQFRVFVRLPDFSSRNEKSGGQLLELQWDWRVNTRIQKQPLTEGELEYLRAQWPVHFDLDRLTKRVSRHSGWILGNDAPLNGVLCACPLVYGSGDVLAPASSVLDECHRAKTLLSQMTHPKPVSPGALW